MSFDPGTASFRLRLQVNNAGGDVAAANWQIYVSKNGGAYSALTTSSTNGVKSYDAGASADNDPIYVPRLTPPS